MHTLVRRIDQLSVACAVVASIFMGLATLVVVWMVIWRATGHSTYWEIELAIDFIVGAVLVGSPYCLKTKGHIGVDLLSELLPISTRIAVARILALLGMAVCLYLAWRGAELTWDAFEKGERSGSLWNPPRWPLYATMPVGLGLTALQYVAELLRPPADESGERHGVSGQGA